LGNIVIFAGGFGSGKSEVALNYALNKAQTSKNVILADLDLVNPYFVSRDLRIKLEQSGIRLAAPEGQLSFGDVPSVPREMIGLIKQENEMIIDLAGDEVGSIVLGYLSNYVAARRTYEFLLVLNPYRPFAEDLESVTLLKQGLERVANLKFTGIVSNPNLLSETNPEVIREGHELVAGFAKALDIPVAFLTIEEKFYDELFPDYGEQLQVINLYLKPSWL
jgi:MinD-like ATPase involved in chromosome partitioning or flagellar assembly